MHINTTLSPLQGFHPTSSSTIYPPPTLDQSCLLYLYLSLPPPVFVDTHELRLHAARYAFEHWGTRDLESPVHALPDRSKRSELLVHVHEWTTTEAQGSPLRVDVPLHLRYGTPTPATSSKREKEKEKTQHEEVRVDWPTAFFLCPPTTSSVACVLVDQL